MSGVWWQVSLWKKKKKYKSVKFKKFNKNIKLDKVVNLVRGVSVTMGLPCLVFTGVFQVTLEQTLMSSTNCRIVFLCAF